VHFLAKEILTEEFIQGKLGFEPEVRMGYDKMFITGQSIGGWTSIYAACGDQEYFKATLSHDPAFYPHINELTQDEIDIKVPCHMS
jgi:enterochelin esterase-like enzyme